MNEIEKLSIFWNESAIYVLVYAGYALLVCAVFWSLELRLAKDAGSSTSRLLLHNALLAVLAIALFTLSLLVSGWYHRLFGGEIGAFAASLGVFLLALYLLKTWSIRKLSLGYRSAMLVGVGAAVWLAAPYALGTLFLFLLASGMRN